jgi:hypothetical protein
MRAGDDPGGSSSIGWAADGEPAVSGTEHALTLQPSGRLPDLQVGLQFEFEAGLGGDLQMLLATGRNDGASRCACRCSNECARPSAGNTADQGSQSGPPEAFPSDPPLDSATLLTTG